MNFGANIFDWFLANAQPLVLLALVVSGLIMAYKREFTKLIVIAVVGIIAVGFVFNTTGTKDVMLKFYNKVIVEEAAPKQTSGLFDEYLIEQNIAA